MGRRVENINESVSSIVFHFLPLQAMYNIALEDKMLLSTSHRESDKRMSGGYPYFLSLSRTPSSAVGYQRMRINGTGAEWLTALVRIEFDGNLLNTEFKGSPQNYFTDKNDSKINHDSSVYAITKGKDNLVKREMPRLSKQVDSDETGRLKMPRGRHTHPYGYTDYKIIDRNQMLEYEDRIVSNKPEINGIGRFIKRIDILFKKRPKKTNEWEYILSELGEIIRKYGDKVHLYNSEVSFNSFNVRNRVGTNDARYGEIDINTFITAYKKSLSTRLERTLSSQRKHTIAKCAYCVSYVKSIINGTSVLNEYQDALNTIGTPEISKDSECNEFIENLVGKFSENYVKFLPKTLSNEIGRDLIGPARKYFDNIIKLFVDTVNEAVSKLNFKKQESSSPYRLLSVFSNLWIRTHKRFGMVAESK